jgi:beta-glucosidase
MNYVKDRYNSPPVYITENGKSMMCLDCSPANQSYRLIAENCTRVTALLKIEFWQCAIAYAGMDDSNNPFISLKDALKDSKRIKYHNDYLTNLAASIKYCAVPFLNLC